MLQSQSHPKCSLSISLHLSTVSTVVTLAFLGILPSFDTTASLCYSVQLTLRHGLCVESSGIAKDSPNHPIWERIQPTQRTGA